MSANNHPLVMDAETSVFFKRELEHVMVKTYDTKYEQLKVMNLLPKNFEAGSGSNEITYRRYTGVGFAKIIADYSVDFPRVDVYGEEVTSKIKGIGASYGWSIKELRASAKSNKRLDQRKADFARKAIDTETNDIAMLGNDEHGLVGLFNNPNITEATIINDGTGSSKLWANKTPDQIVRDFNTLVNAIMVPTKGMEVPDTVWLPLGKYNYISQTRMSTTSDMTILQYILATSPVIKKIDWINDLAGMGAGGTDRMFMLSLNANTLELHIPQPFEQFPPVQKHMDFEISCHAETAGVLVYYPMAVCYADGI